MWRTVRPAATGAVAVRAPESPVLAAAMTARGPGQWAAAESIGVRAARLGEPGATTAEAQGLEQRAATEPVATAAARLGVQAAPKRADRRQAVGPR